MPPSRAKRCLLCSLRKASKTKPCRPCVGPWDSKLPQVLPLHGRGILGDHDNFTWFSVHCCQCCWIEVPSLCPPCTSLMSSLGLKIEVQVVWTQSASKFHVVSPSLVRSLVVVVAVVVVLVVVVVVAILVYSSWKVASGVVHKSTSILPKLYGAMLSVQSTKN